MLFLDLFKTLIQNYIYFAQFCIMKLARSTVYIIKMKTVSAGSIVLLRALVGMIVIAFLFHLLTCLDYHVNR